MQAKFLPGRLVATPNALRRVPEPEISIALLRHIAGDWGDLDQHDRNENESALIHGRRLLSAYCSTDSTRFWIVTEADRSVTTVLLPEDY